MEGSAEDEELTVFLMINSAVGHEAAQKLKERLAETETETAKENMKRQETALERVNALVSIKPSFQSFWGSTAGVIAV